MVSDEHAPVLVSGMHRSGTTFVGKVFSASESVISLHEPFNSEYGIQGLNIVYPAKLDAQIKNLMDEVLSLDFNVVRAVGSDSLPKAFARRVLGGRTNIDRLKARLKMLVAPQNRRLLFKDPFMLALSSELAEVYCIKSVITVRHPVAIWRSICRMGWSFDFGSFADDEFTFQYSGKTKAELSALSELDRFSYLYLILYSSALRSASNTNLIKLTRHEDICLNPFEEFLSLSKYLDIDFSPSMEKLLNETTCAADSEPNNRNLHNFRRDSKALAWAWCEKVKPEEEIRIAEICGSLVEELYGYWRPGFFR